MQYIHRPEAESPEVKEQEELVTSTVRPEEIPPIPENRFLMRRSPQSFQMSKEGEKDQRNRDERQRERLICLTNSHCANYMTIMLSSGFIFIPVFFL